MVTMWPAGVNSKPDMDHFCRMMVGPDLGALDYDNRMPSPRQDCFLFFIKGGCVDGTLLYGLRDCVPDLMAELRSLAQNPDVAVRTGSITGESWYDHGQLSKSSCTCRLNFGGEKGSKTRKNQVVDCAGLAAGRKFEAVLMKAIRRNYPADPARAPVYFDKAFHALLNDTDHRKCHRIAFHSDQFPGSYVAQDPITSFSWGCTGVLVLRPAPRTKGQTHLIVTRHGDVSIMGGEFQQYFEHAVPPVSAWPALLETYRPELQPWEIEAMEVEIAEMGVEESGPRTRHNITVRWHHHHTNCLWAKDPVHFEPVPVSFVAAAISQFSTNSFAKPPFAYKLGTEYRPFPYSGVSSTVAQPVATSSTVPVTVAATGGSEATACGDTRPSDDTLARAFRKVEMVDKAVQTSEVMPRCNISTVLTESTNVVSAAYRAVEFLPAMLLTCSFTGTENEWSTERPCMDKLRAFVDAMEINLDRFEDFLEDMGVVEQESFQRMVDQNSSVLHVLRSALHHRFELKRHVDRLLESGATFYETKVKNDQRAISNSQWLTKVTLSHAEFQELIEYMDLQSLQRYGDIVFKLPRDMHKLDMSREGEHRPAKRGDMVYVGFFDIGIRSEVTTRRMHLRAAPDQLGAWENYETATRVLENVKSVLLHCLIHVRHLDVQRTGRAREADSLGESYDRCLWIGPHQKRMAHLRKQLRGKGSSPTVLDMQSSTSFAASSAGWNTWKSDQWQ